MGRTFEAASTCSRPSPILPPPRSGREILYERLEFLGDSICRGAGGRRRLPSVPQRTGRGDLTRIRWPLVSGAGLSEVAEKLRFADVIVFGSSETGTGRRGLHSALERLRGWPAGGAVLLWWHRCSVGLKSIARSCPRCRWIARPSQGSRAPCRRSCGEGGITPTLSVGGDPRRPTAPSSRPGAAGGKGLAQKRRPHEEEAESQAANPRSRASRILRHRHDRGRGRRKRPKAARRKPPRRQRWSRRARLQPPRRPPRGPSAPP